MHSLRLRFCRRTAWLGVFALLFQAWLPLVHHPATLFAPTGDETEAFDQLLGQTMVLCTMSGLVQKDGPAGDHSPAHQPPPCPICQSLHIFGSFTAPNGVAPLECLTLPRRYKAWAQGPSPSARFDSAVRARAPPIPA